MECVFQGHKGTLNIKQLELVWISVKPNLESFTFLIDDVFCLSAVEKYNKWKTKYEVTFKLINRESSCWKLVKKNFYTNHVDNLSKFASSINERQSSRPRSILVFLNPYGGKGNADKVWNVCSPLFPQRHVNVTDVIRTERAGHAKNIVKNLNLNSLDAIVCVGGDGTLNEVIEALTRRKEQGEFDNIPVKLGLIPAGSTNATNATLSRVVDPFTVTLQILMGYTMPMDVLIVRKNCGILHSVSVNTLACGFLGALLVHSEKMRSLGAQRYFLAALSTLSPPFSAVELNAEFTSLETPTLERACGSGCTICESASRETLASLQSTTQRIEGQFAYVQFVCSRCVSPNTPHGVFPHAHSGDGTFAILLMKHRPAHYYWDSIRLFFRFRSRNPPENSQIISLSNLVKASIEVKPINSNHTSEAPVPWNCDGEVIHGDKFHVEVDCKMIDFFAYSQCK